VAALTSVLPPKAAVERTSVDVSASESRLSEIVTSSGRDDRDIVQGARVLERPSAAFVASPQKNMNFSTSRRCCRRRYHVTVCPRRSSSPILQNLIFCTHTLIPPVECGSAPRGAPNSRLDRGPQSAHRISLGRRQSGPQRERDRHIDSSMLPPELVKAAVEGRLPRGIGVVRLRDASAEWSRQYAMLGLSV
jgi:hypothetical protein